MNSTNRPVRIYLAGPFFNQAQIELITSVEESLDANNIPYFSPRKMALNGKPTSTKPTPEQANSIFRKDYEEITKSTHVIAILDWALMPGVTLRLCKEHQTSELALGGAQNLVSPISDHLPLPDSGTVWEMGCAYALRVPIYLYTAHPAARLNLMLTQSARGVLYGGRALDDFLAEGLNEDLLEPWKGDHR